MDGFHCNSASTACRRRNRYILYIVCGIFALNILLYLYEYSCRICTLAEWAVVLDVMKEPQYNNLCKKASSTTYRCLPTVFFIGVSKGGTTSIASQLSTHPKLHFIDKYINYGPAMETHRFDRNLYPYVPHFIELSEEYALSPEITDLSDLIIHYTPHYMYAPSVPFDLRQFHPDPDNIKFIISLREPYDRSVSSYWFRQSNMFLESDEGSVSDMLSVFHKEMSEREKYDACRQSHGGFNTSYAVSEQSALVNCFGISMYRSKTLMHRHIDKSIYFDQFQRWFANFNRDQFFVTTIEEYSSNTTQTLLDICKFLGVEGLGEHGWSLEELKNAVSIKKNTTSNKKKKNASLDDEDAIKRWFDKYNRKLVRELNGRNLGY